MNIKMALTGKNNQMWILNFKKNVFLPPFFFVGFQPPLLGFAFLT